MRSSWMLLPLLQILLLHSSDALIGGHDAVAGQFPFQALIRGLPGDDMLRQFSSGVLIHPEWVLTNAEGISEFEGLIVSLGVVHRNSTADWRQDIPALRVFLHPEWPTRAQWHKMHLNDIALIRLARPARLNDRVKIAYLPQKKSYNSNRATVSGWGLHRTILYNTMTMSFIKCFWERMGETSEESGWIHLNHICADTRGNGPCVEDGGAPLMLMTEAETKGVVLGVFSTPTIYGTACQDDHPSVFTRVSSHLLWIDEVSGVRPP